MGKKTAPCQGQCLGTAGPLGEQMPLPGQKSSCSLEAIQPLHSTRYRILPYPYHGASDLPPLLVTQDDGERALFGVNALSPALPFTAVPSYSLASCHRPLISRTLVDKIMCRCQCIVGPQQIPVLCFSRLRRIW